MPLRRAYIAIMEIGSLARVVAAGANPALNAIPCDYGGWVELRRGESPPRATLPCQTPIGSRWLPPRNRPFFFLFHRIASASP